MTNRRDFLKWMASMSAGAIIVPLAAPIAESNSIIDSEEPFNTSKGLEFPTRFPKEELFKHRSHDDFVKEYFNFPYPEPPRIDIYAQRDFWKSEKKVKFFENRERRSGKTFALCQCMMMHIYKKYIISPSNILFLSSTSLSCEHARNLFCEKFLHAKQCTFKKGFPFVINIPHSENTHHTIAFDVYERIDKIYPLSYLFQFDLICLDDLYAEYNTKKHYHINKPAHLLHIQTKHGSPEKPSIRVAT